MDSDQGILSASDRPDLDEFLSALSGFLDKQTSPSDPSYLRFVAMFCRSVGATEGHLLRRGDAGQLNSVTSFGLVSTFDDDFNKTHLAATTPSPLDEAFHRKEVVAIVDLKKDPDIPPWFMEIMDKHNFSSLVAVPLIGQTQAVGILCAYYHDVCLFDQNTLDHLMMIGRMVGAATEKSLVADRAVSTGVKDKASDDFLELLTDQNYTKLNVFQGLVKIAAREAAPSAIFAGPVKKEGNSLILTVAAAEGLPTSLITSRVTLPRFIMQKLTETPEGLLLPITEKKDWEALAGFVKDPNARPFCFPLAWKRKIEGALIGWTAGPMSEDDLILMRRLCRISSLAMNAQ